MQLLNISIAFFILPLLTFLPSLNLCYGQVIAEEIDLTKMAEAKFADLSWCEKQLLYHAQYGDLADCLIDPNNKESNGPAMGEHWGKERQIRANLLDWLCHNPKAKNLINDIGILVMHARITGELNLVYINLQGVLYIGESYFDNDLNLWGAHISSLVLSGTHCHEINLTQAKIDNGLYLNDNFTTYRQIILAGANIGGDLNCENGQFRQYGDVSIDAERIIVNGSVLLKDGFESKGEVILTGAKINGNLDCSGGYFLNKNSLIVNSAIISKNVVIEGATVAGLVNFSDSRIEQNFTLIDINTTPEFRLDLSAATISVLNDAAASWPVPGSLILHGLTFKGISASSPVTPMERLDWIHRQKKYSPQPYEQLAKFYQDQGDENGTIAVKIAKSDALLESKYLTFFNYYWLKFLGITIGYGYKPWRPLWAMIFLILTGYIIFKYGYKWKIVTSSKDFKSDYPRFNAFMYSVDMFIPIINLYMRDYWLPNTNRFHFVNCNYIRLTISGNMLRYYLWFHIICGWVLTTLFVLGFTGLIKK